jgi:ProP effector
MSSNKAKRAKEVRAAEIAIGLLAERFPKCFTLDETRRPPLKIGIREDIVAYDVISSRKLGLALRTYCRNPVYLQSIKVGAKRIDLDGNVTSIVTADEEQIARERLRAHGAAAKRALRAAEKAAEKRQRESAAAARITLADLRRAAQQRKAASPVTADQKPKQNA